MNKQEALKEVRFMVYLERKHPFLELLYFFIKVQEDPDYWAKVREIAFGKKVK